MSPTEQHDGEGQEHPPLRAEAEPVEDEDDARRKRQQAYGVAAEIAPGALGEGHGTRDVGRDPLRANGAHRGAGGRQQR
jgi:hypothetical protein